MRPMLRRRLPLTLPTLIWLAASALGNAATAGTVDFNRDIQPILSDNCYQCHGPDEHARKAKLRLDRKEGAYGKNDDGRAIVAPGKPEESKAFQLITAKDESAMPQTPQEPLNADDIEAVRRWIAAGAPPYPANVPIPAEADNGGVFKDRNVVGVDHVLRSMGKNQGADAPRSPINRSRPCFSIKR